MKTTEMKTTEMKTTEELENALLNASPGTVITVKDYKDSSGRVKDLRVELLDSKAYWRMLRQDREMLEAMDESDIADKGGELPFADLLAARTLLIQARSESLRKRKEGVTYRRGPVLESVGEGSLARMPDKPEALYLLRTMLLSEKEEVKPAKGALPRAKQILSADLPSSKYVHMLKFEDGSFGSVVMEKLVVGSDI